MSKLLLLTSAFAVIFAAEVPQEPGLGKIIRSFLNSQPNDLKISEGVHIVRSGNDARSLDDGSWTGAMESYLQSHELRIRLPELMPGEGLGRALKDVLSDVDEHAEGSPRGGGGGGGGGGGKGGGGGGIMILGLMFGKLLAAIGLGGVGLLAMKALMVSALALVLSTIIGLKKLLHDDHGHSDHGHTVIHAGHGHEYRKKREASNIAYQGWES